MWLVASLSLDVLLPPPLWDGIYDTDSVGLSRGSREITEKNLLSTLKSDISKIDLDISVLGRSGSQTVMARSVGIHMVEKLSEQVAPVARLQIHYDGCHPQKNYFPWDLLVRVQRRKSIGASRICREPHYSFWISLVEWHEAPGLLSSLSAWWTHSCRDISDW